MYRTSTLGQLSFENFYLPFGGHLNGENRWVKLAAAIPWEAVEASYAEQFSDKMGSPAKSFRLALGALIIKEKLGTSDRETVEQIRENPYLQYFLGFSGYQDKAPFDASMLVHFRQRIDLELVAQVNELVVHSILDSETRGAVDEQPSESDDDDEGPRPPNQGQLLMDATCAPADIRYPTDLSLLNEARQDSEAIVDVLYAQLKGAMDKKPRTYRKLARKAYLIVAKQRKPRRTVRRRGIYQQLNFLRRNLKHIDALVAAGAVLAKLSRRRYRQLLVIGEVHRQQREMYERRSRRIDDRIVSISQPYVRPIVRGKAGAQVEFGAKLSVSYVNGCVFLDVLSWDNFNESTHLEQQVEAYHQRFGYYPESVHADQIYRTRANRSWCKERGIRLSGTPLGRPTKNTTLRSEQKRLAREDEKRRVAIEGKFGQAKRRFSLDCVMPKLVETAQCAIAITFLVLNLERWLRQLLSLLFGIRVQRVLKPLKEFCKVLQTAIFTVISAAGFDGDSGRARHKFVIANC